MDTTTKFILFFRQIIPLTPERYALMIFPEKKKARTRTNPSLSIHSCLHKPLDRQNRASIWVSRRVIQPGSLHNHNSPEPTRPTRCSKEEEGGISNNLTESATTVNRLHIRCPRRRRAAM